MKNEIVKIGKNLENNDGKIIEDIKNKILTIYSDIDDLVNKTGEARRENKEKRIMYFGITIIPILLGLVTCRLESLRLIFTLLFSLVGTGYVITDFISNKLEIEKNEQLKELNEQIVEIKEDIDNHFYESYVLTDYFKDNNYKLRDLKQMNEYLSKFDKDKPNSCFNEVGMEYNYSPISESKLLEIKKKPKDKSEKDKSENDKSEKYKFKFLNITLIRKSKFFGILKTKDQEKDKLVSDEKFEVIVDTSLVDKYLEQPILLETKEHNSSVNNLVLKPGVFDRQKKKINKNNNGYTHIEFSIGKVKILTIDKRSK